MMVALGNFLRSVLLPPRRGDHPINTVYGYPLF